MTEGEYRDTTNLAKLRTLYDVLDDVRTDGKIVTDDGLRQIAVIVSEWTEKLEKVVRTR